MPTGGMRKSYTPRLNEESIAEIGLTKEQYLDSQSIQRILLKRINAIADNLANTPEPPDDTDDTNIESVVADPLVSEPLFDFLIQEDRLPETAAADKQIIYELLNNRIVVRVMPSACHNYTAASFTEDLLFWAASGGVRNTLKIGHGARTQLIYLLLTSLVFPWAVGSKKSPDNSFRPTFLQSPPGRFIGSSNVLYPNFTVEIAKSHESWDQLLSDANAKHFSPLTGIVVWLGIKIYNSERMRVCLSEWDKVQGYGAVDPPLACTGFIRTNVPCNASITIPKRLIYYGVPNGLIPTTISPDYILDLNIVREAVFW